MSTSLLLCINSLHANFSGRIKIQFEIFCKFSVRLHSEDTELFVWFSFSSIKTINYFSASKTRKNCEKYFIHTETGGHFWRNEKTEPFPLSRYFFCWFFPNFFTDYFCPWKPSQFPAIHHLVFFFFTGGRVKKGQNRKGLVYK